MSCTNTVIVPNTGGTDIDTDTGNASAYAPKWPLV